MKNKYRFEGDKCYIALNFGLETVIDAADFDLVNSYAGTWNAGYREDIRGYYCFINLWGEDKRNRGTSMHRALLGVTDRNMQVDHRNHDTLDNTRENIRIVTRSENQHNHIRPPARNTSGFMGVSRMKGSKRFRAFININSKQKHLGCFGTAEEAANAYRDAKRRYHGVELPEPTPQSGGMRA